MNYKPHESHESSHFLLWLEMWCETEPSIRVKLVPNPQLVELIIQSFLPGVWWDHGQITFSLLKKF